MKRKFLIFGILVSIFLTLHSAKAQVIFGQKGYFSSSLIYAGWNIKDSEETKLSEWAGVVRIFLPLSDNLELRFFSTGAAADLTSPSSQRSLSGFNDARIQGAYSFADDTFLLIFGFNVPTGKKSLTEDEFEIAHMLADNSMRFPVRRYGEGLDLSTGLVMAQEVGGVIVGLGGGYLLKGKYALLSSTTDKYKPGDELTFSLGMDVKKTKTMLRLDGIFTHFMSEKYGGEKFFQKGNIYEISALLSHSGKKTGLSLSVQTLLRGKDHVVNETGFSYEENNSHGNEYRGYMNFTYALSKTFSARGLLELRSIAANQYPKEDPLYKGKSQFFGGGAGCDLRIVEKVKLNVMVEYLAGETDDGRKDLTGVNAEAGITVGF